VPCPHRDLVDADRLNLAQGTMGQPIGNHPLDGPVHTPPTGTKISATSLHDRRLAQRDRKRRYALQAGVLPSAHGTRSTVTPHLRQSIRRITYHKNTVNPHSGMNANPRGLLAVS
jgi:hypothetical protein